MTTGLGHHHETALSGVKQLAEGFEVRPAQATGDVPDQRSTESSSPGGLLVLVDDVDLAVVITAQDRRVEVVFAAQSAVELMTPS